MAILVRSAIFNVLFYTVLVALMVFGLPTILFGRKGVFFLARLWARISLFLLHVVCNLRVEYRGVDNIPSGGYIIAAKHQSSLETFALLEHSPDFAIVLKRELLYIPIFGLYLMVSRQIAIDRARGRSALSQITGQAGNVLLQKRQVYIYPEGTRRPVGAPAEYKFGVTAIYAASHAPCLPVALNTGLFWGRRGFVKRPGVAVIEYLPPIPPGLDRARFAAELQENIESACYRLNAEALTNDPSLKPMVWENSALAPMTARDDEAP